MKTPAHAIGASLLSCSVALCGSAPAHVQSTRPASAWPAVVGKLAELVRTDPQAAALFAPLLATADRSLDGAPSPIATIRSEGLLQGHPLKVKTQSALKDMPALRTLSWASVMTGDRRYAEKATTILRAWAELNRSRGNPIDDTKLEFAILAYAMLSERVPPDDRKAIEAWLRGIADAHMRAKQLKNNWQDHRIKIVGLIGYALNEPAYISYAIESWQKQLDGNLLPDGSTSDFHERDALHYHVYTIEPLLALAAVAQDRGTDLYRLASPRAASLDKSVAFLRPFVTGERTHIEFTNSKVEFDRKRANNGEKHYQPHPWEPGEALPALTAASQFDPAYDELVQQLAKAPAARYASWDALVASVRRDTVATKAPTTP